MTTPASSARPPWARMVWSDSNSIFVEVPASDGGVPFILKFDHSDGGLSKALLLLRDAHERADKTNYTTPKDDPRIKKAGRSFAFTDQQRSAVHDLLLRRGIIKGKE